MAKPQGRHQHVQAPAIRHAEIPNLQMGGMTMVFKAAPEILARAREGERSASLPTASMVR
jgi:Cu/Ag efflux protein CusF